MAEPDGVDGRHKAGHDGGGSPLIVIAIRAKMLRDPPFRRRLPAAVAFATLWDYPAATDDAKEGKAADHPMRQRFAPSRRVCRAHGWPRRRRVGLLGKLPILSRSVP